VTLALSPQRLAGWLGFVLAVGAHLGLLFGVIITTEVPPPVVRVDTTLSEMVKPPPKPPPPPPKAAAKVVHRSARRARPGEAPRITPSDGDEAPPPPSNRPPSSDAANEPVPVITGVSIPLSKVTSSVRVRAGNTDVPGFDPDGPMPDDVRGYSGGVPGGVAKQSGGRGPAGPGVGGGRPGAARLTKLARVIRRYKPHYPRELVDANVEGKVRLRVEVLASGKTGRVEVTKSSGNARLDAIAVKALKRFVWAPGEIEGEVVTSWVPHTMRFELYE
jgi:TonB family protein